MKFTKQTRDAIVASLRSGNFLETAAAKAGVSSRQVRTWLAKGAAGEPSYVEFLRDVEAANATAESAFQSVLNRAAQEGTWQAAAWTLERRFPQRWQLGVRKTIEEEHRAFIESLRAELTTAEFERVVEAVESIERRRRLALSVSDGDAIEADGENVPRVLP